MPTEASLMGRRGQPRPSSPLDAGFAASLADTMFALSTPSRVQILYSLLERPHDVTELVEALGMQQSAVSHQLRVLREQELVQVERDGHRRVYALASDHVSLLLEQAARHVEERTRERGLISRVRRVSGR
jgi:DNA-binding transcriptional ArsR family regulator